MNPDSAPRALRAIISIIGCRNAGKSSLLNALTEQQVSIVSEHAGTTTDAVAKAYELLPLGPVTFYDTAGFDDKGELGNLRIKATAKILYKSDIAVIVVSENGLTSYDKDFIAKVQDLKIPFVIAFNKADKQGISARDKEFCLQNKYHFVEVSAQNGTNIDKLKQKLVEIAPKDFKDEQPLVSDLVKQGDRVVMVVPVDLSAPKGRLILPQVQVLRELLDSNAQVLVCKDNELASALSAYKEPPALVISDSQVVMKVAPVVPEKIEMTTFSTLFARYKGDIKILYNGAEQIDKLKTGDKVLIAEACSHHTQEDDIGRVKIPNWLKKYCGCELDFEFYVGCDFPDNLEQYALVIHCGACMLNKTEMVRRLRECERRGVAITNYGIAISKTQGVLERVIKPLKAHF